MMKSFDLKAALLLVVSVAALLWSLGTVTGGQAKREQKPRFKGVEVYSWKDAQNTWQYAIVDGTNDIKTEQQIKNAQTVYAGLDKFTDALKLLAVGEQVSWSRTHVQGFDYPPADDLKKVDAAAKDAKIKLVREKN
jgi:hypothetical protein